LFKTSSYKFLPRQTGGDGNQQVCNRGAKCIGAAATKTSQAVVEYVEL